MEFKDHDLTTATAVPGVRYEERALRHARNTPLAVAEDGSHLIDRFAGLWQFYGTDVPDTVVARNFCESLRGGPVACAGM